MLSNHIFSCVTRRRLIFLSEYARDWMFSISLRPFVWLFIICNLADRLVVFHKDRQYLLSSSNRRITVMLHQISQCNLNFTSFLPCLKKNWQAQRCWFSMLSKLRISQAGIGSSYGRYADIPIILWSALILLFHAQTAVNLDSGRIFIGFQL